MRYGLVLYKGLNVLTSKDSNGMEKLQYKIQTLTEKLQCSGFYLPHVILVLCIISS